MAAAVAFGLRFLLFNTRLGVAMRAQVDDRVLTSLNGAQPERVALASWALGSMLAALSGVLLASVLQLNVLPLTLLVVNGYAAAMVGRLKSLPLTFLGAVALGLVESFAIGYLPSEGLWSNAKAAIPILFLFIVLLVLPEERWLDAEPYHERFTWTQKWPRANWTLAYQGNLHEVPEADFALLEGDMAKAAAAAPA